MEGFNIATITLAGLDHLVIGKPNQDSFYLLEQNGITIGIVSDGCGSCPYSQVGSHFGARSIANLLMKLIVNSPTRGDLPKLLSDSDYNFSIWSELTRQWLSYASWFVRSYNTNFYEFTKDQMYFTLVGFVADAEHFVTFSFGDGFVGLNGILHELAPMQLADKKNAPAYLSYLMFPQEFRPPAEFLRFRVNFFTELDTLENFIISTDGLAHWPKQSKPVPGPNKELILEPVGEFWKSKNLYDDSSGFEAKLRACANPLTIWGEIKDRNSNSWQIKNAKGFLKDDLTFISGIRKTVVIDETFSITI